MSIHSTKKIADGIGLKSHKDYTRVLAFIAGNRIILKPHELAKMKKLVQKDSKILIAAIEEAEAKTRVK